MQTTLAVVIGLIVNISLPAGGRLADAPPAAVGLDATRLARIDGIVDDALKAKRMPGCVVLIGRHGKIAFAKAYGHRALQPSLVPMTRDTVFDLASVTKPVATATSIMLLVERGQVRLGDRVAEHLPGFEKNGKDKVTIAQCLTHTAGFIPDNALADYRDGAEKAIEHIYDLKPANEPGTKFVYSDVGFIALGEIVRKKTGQNVHEFSRDALFQPLGMTETGYLPAERLRARAAVTQQRDGKWMQGEVHDPRAHLLGGVAGHAGLFSTAADLAIFAQMMLRGGRYGGKQILGARTVALMTTPQQLPGDLVRGFGWDMRSSYSSNRGETFTPRAFGHGGFTGTGLWIDPGLDLFVVFLSNRVHPDGKGLVNPLIGRIGAIAASAIVDQPNNAPLTTQPPKLVTPPAAANGVTPAPQILAPAVVAPTPTKASAAPMVLTGIDVLKRDGFAPLKGRMVGLITNHTGLDRDGNTTIDLLHGANDVKLVALFSPEHGIRGELDAKVDDGKDAKTGLPIYSLYGKTRKPSPEHLAGIDTLVFDIQDIGARFYTYISTMGLAMEAAAEKGLRFVVLDRPNPIGGAVVAGPILDAGKESFIAYTRLPVQHGMTIGELATLFRSQKCPKLELTIVRVEGWKRRDLLDATGLVWTNPSPNMRCLTQAVLYPGIGLLETTNLSVGRGTDTPFEVIGAPWLDGRGLAAHLHRRDLPGVRFIPVRFAPRGSKFQNKPCGGVNIVITDRAAFASVRTGMEIAAALQALYPGVWEIAAYNRLLGHAATLAALQAGRPIADIEAMWSVDMFEFRERRERALLYP